MLNRLLYVGWRPDVRFILISRRHRQVLFLNGLNKFNINAPLFSLTGLLTHGIRTRIAAGKSCED